MKSKRQVLLDSVKMSTIKVDKKKNSKLMDYSSPTVCYPTLWLNTKQAPDLEGKEAGEEVELVVKGKVTNHSINSNTGTDGKNNKRESHDIQITEIGLVK